VAPPARGNIIVQTLRDGSRVFKLRLRARGRREMEVVHERRDCSCGCGGGWNERAHLLARWLRRQHDCRRRPRRVSDVSRRTRSARPAAGIGAVIRNPRPLRGGRATQGTGYSIGYLRPENGLGAFGSDRVRSDETACSQAVPEMARPGLEPGTPRFSVVRPSRLKLASSQGIPGFWPRVRRPRFPGLCAGFPGVTADGGGRLPFRRWPWRS
jgi:hypothetical protein